MAPIFGAGLLMVATLVAPQADTTSIQALVAEARAASPRILAARLRADAALQRIGPAGALPDPMLSAGLMNRSITDPTRSDIQMTMNQLQVSQRLPWWGRRASAEAQAQALSDAERNSAREVEATIVGRVERAYYEIAYLDRTSSTMDENRDLLRSFHELSESLYSVGAGLQSDVLQAQISIARTTADLTVLVERRAATAARLNALLGRAPESTVGATRLPAIGDELPAVASLIARAAASRPALAAARSRIQAAEAAREHALINSRPDITLMAAYGHRSDFADLGSLSIGVNLPIFSGSKQQPVRRESEAQLMVRQAEELEILNETYAALTELRAQAERARSLERIYTTSILPQADAAVEAALSAYQVGRVDYMTLLDAQTTVNRFEIERLRLAADYHIAVAEIEALLGARLQEITP